MRINKKTDREKILRALRLEMARDKTCPSKISKWLKLMECKKKLFSLEDEIDRITHQLQNKEVTQK